MWSGFINDERYKKYFTSNEDVWKESLEKVKKYIDENDSRPSTTSKIKETKILGSWIANQQNNYASKKQIMSDKTIYDMWSGFINDERYKKYFSKRQKTDSVDLTEVTVKRKIIKTPKDSKTSTKEVIVVKTIIDKNESASESKNKDIKRFKKVVNE